MKRLLLAAAAVAALLSTAGVANATPQMSIEIFDGATLIGSSLNVSGGGIGLTASSANFSIVSVSALGVPVIPTPDLSSTNLSATTTSGHGVLTIMVTQTGLTQTALALFQSSFTFNALTGLASSAVFTNYIDAGNAAFGMVTQIATANLSPVVTAVGPLNDNIGPFPLFSETQKYVITFTGTSTQSVSATDQIIDAPEPMSLGLLGAGLLGLGITRRRAKRAA